MQVGPWVERGRQDTARAGSPSCNVLPRRARSCPPSRASAAKRRATIAPGLASFEPRMDADLQRLTAEAADELGEPGAPSPCRLRSSA